MGKFCQDKKDETSGNVVIMTLVSLVCISLFFFTMVNSTSRFFYFDDKISHCVYSDLVFHIDFTTICSSVSHNFVRFPSITYTVHGPCCLLENLSPFRPY